MELMTRTCNYERMNVQRFLARAFVVVGGLLWTIMLFASETAAKYTNFTYTFEEVAAAAGTAALPLAIAVLVFVVGWFYEKLAALLLLLAAIGVAVYGFTAAWTVAIWVLVGLVLIAPLLVAALLYLLASTMQTVCSLEGHPDA